MICLHSSTCVYTRLHSSRLVCICLHRSSDLSTLVYIHQNLSSDSSAFFYIRLHSSAFVFTRLVSRLFFRTDQHIAQCLEVSKNRSQHCISFCHQSDRFFQVMFYKYRHFADTLYTAGRGNSQIFSLISCLKNSKLTIYFGLRDIRSHTFCPTFKILSV